MEFSALRDTWEKQMKEKASLGHTWCFNGVCGKLQRGRNKTSYICDLLLLFEKKENISHYGKLGKLGPGSPFARQGPAQCSGARGTMGAEEKSGDNRRGKQVLAWLWWQGT